MNKDELLKGSPQQKDILSVEDKKLINEELGLSVNEDHSGTVPESFRREFLQEIINEGQGMTQAYKDAAASISKELGLEFVEFKVNPLTPEQMKESFSGVPTLDRDEVLKGPLNTVNHGQGMTQAYKDAAASISKELGLKFVEKDETVKNINQIRESVSDLDKSNNPTLK